MNILDVLVPAVCLAIPGAFIGAAWVLATTQPCTHPECTASVRKPRTRCDEHTRPRPEQPGDVSRLDRLAGIHPTERSMWVPRTDDEAAAWWDEQIARGEH